MPRDLAEEKGSVWKGIAQTEGLQDVEVTQSHADADTDDSTLSRSQIAATSRKKTVKTYTQALTSLDLGSCVKLEEITFPENERCSREKFEYRFANCSELFLGLFTSADTTQPSPQNPDPTKLETAATAQPVYSGTPARKSILLGHVIATKTTNSGVRDEDMGMPSDWKALHTKSASPSKSDDLAAASRPGHHPEGRTLCIHSLAIHPEYQGMGLGKLLLHAYIQRMDGSGVADRISIIVHDHLVAFYEKIGFMNRGPSPSTHGGGSWSELELALNNAD